MALNPEDEINRLNAALQDTLRLLAELKSASIANRGGVISQAELAAQERYNALLAERARLVGAAGGNVSRTGGGVNIAGGYQQGEPVHTVNPTIDYSRLSDREQQAIREAEAKANAQQNKILQAKIKQVEQEEKRYAQAEKAGLKIGESDAAFIKANQRAAAAAEKEALEKQKTADLQARIANDPVYRNYVNQLRARGLDIQDITSAESRGGGITRVSASRNIGGINQKYNAFVNEATGVSQPGLSSQFRSFGKDILRDIGQFTKWSIAIAAVYTPIQKLGELITVMIDNESRLADATIAANVPFSKAGEIFDTVAISADKSGEAINTTIDAYTSAIRAAGRYGDTATKETAAVKLLNDSLILSKLSALDQSESIDTLSAALLQSDRSLTQGTELLNKWVRVSQIANVGIDALATGVAVLGDTAETVGLSVDQLNGLIAVLSEQSISGAKEAANTAKALVGAYQSDKAEAALNKYGIALRKANGEVRGFLDIYQELARLRQQGVLSEAAVSEVALALGGGGVRRAKDASALINSTDRLNKIAAESASITGADTLAQDQLAKKLETVQTANTRLANSFQELAQTLGTDGGLLDDFKGMINLLTGITKAADGLFALLGRSGPLLATFATGMLALGSMSGATKAVLLSRLGGTFFKGGQFMFNNGPLYGQERAPAGGAYGINGGLARPLGDVLRMNTRGGLLLGGLGVALQGASNIAAGRNENALANVAGGVVGGIVGSLGGPAGIAIGANIGSAVGDAFVTAVDKHSEQLADYFVPKITAGQKAPEAQVTYRGKTTQELLDTAYNSLGFVGKIQAFLNAREARPNAQGIYEQYGNKESAAMDIVKRQNPALYQELYRQFQQQQAQLSAQTAIGTAGTGNDALRKQLEAQGAAARQYQLTQLAAGKITSAEFGRVSNQISGFPAVSIKSVTAFGDELTKVNKDITNVTDAYNSFLYIAQYGTQDQINLISSYSDDILTLQTYLDKLKEQPALVGAKIQLSFGDVTIESPDQLRKLISDLQKQGSTALGVTLQQVQASQAQAVKLPPLVGDYNQPLTGRSQDIIVQRGLAIQQKYLVETGKTADEIAKFKAGIEAFYATVDRGTGAQFEAVNGLTQQFYDLGKAAAEAAGELDKLQPIGFQKFDVPMGQLNMLAQQSLAIGGNWQKKYNYDFKPEDQIAIDNQGIVQPLHADFKILALLLQNLNDKAQKQLDGQYNIPEGATFWVPLTAAYYRNQGGMGGNDLNNALNSLDLGENTSATSNNTRALDQLTGVLSVRDFGTAQAQRYPAEFRHPEGTTSTKSAYTNFKDAQQEAMGLKEVIPTADRRYDTIENIRNGRSFAPTYGQNPLPIPGINKGLGTGTQMNTSPTTKLDLRLSSNVNLMVDGRVLAQTLQTYLAQELIRAEQSQSTITKRYII